MRTIIYVAPDEAAEIFKRKCADIQVNIGTFKGFGKDGYFEALIDTIKNTPNKIDAVIFDQMPTSAVLGEQALIKMLIEHVDDEIKTITQIVVLDEDGEINENGRAFLESRGIRTIDNISNLGPQFKDFDNFKEPKHDETQDKALFPEIPTFKKIQDDPFKTLREDSSEKYVIGRDVSSAEDIDPYKDVLLRNSDNILDPFEEGDNDVAFDSGDGLDAFNGIDEEYIDNNASEASEEFDPFSRAYYEEEQRHLFEFDDDDNNQLQQVDDDEFVDYHDYNQTYGDFSGNLLESDLKHIIEAPYKNPHYDYSEINEGLMKRKSGLNSLFKMGGSENSEIMGEVNEMSFANSKYIKEREDIQGYYATPDTSKIIAVTSFIGGVGKTTVATMIGTQLTWYFNRDLLMRKTTQQQSRILVLSMNEFDDISVKGIGYNDPLGKENDGANVAELKKKIEECDGEPEWDDIAHCFASNPQNHVMYLPSMTLREKMKTGIDITAADYKKILYVCQRFFNFIVIDLPDTFFDQRNGLVQFAYNNADIICMVIQPDLKSTTHLYHFIDGLKAGNNEVLPLDRNRCMLIVNKYISGNNPYIGHTNHRQLEFKDIANSCGHIFSKIEAIPLTDLFMDKNIIFGRDKEVKLAAARITDTILEMIDRNDKKNGL